jgi:DNA-binding transcriptional ArsR family regulator
MILHPLYCRLFWRNCKETIVRSPKIVVHLPVYHVDLRLDYRNVGFFVSRHQLRTEEVPFLEGGTENVLIQGHAFNRPAPKGAAWAASLAVAMRPQLFALGAAPLALAGLAPRALFRLEPEDPVPAILREALGTSVAALRADLDQARHGLTVAEARLSGLYASSRAPDAWALVLGLGPLTRSELARALGVTKRTASQGAEALIAAGLAVLRPSDGALHSVDLQKLARD